MIRNRRGSSFVELLISGAIVLAAFVGTMSFVVNVKNKTQLMLSKRSRSVQLQKVAQMILADPKLFKVNFDPSETATCQALETDSLALGWDDTRIANVEDCIGCKGRLGYVIQPFPLLSVRGVYIVTIRVTHPKITAGSIAMCNGIAIQGAEQLQMIVSLR